MRYIYNDIIQDLENKMVFIGGPRQVGKTTVGEHLLEHIKSGIHLNYDDIDDRTLILKRDWNDSDKLIFIDEFHKYHDWKNFIKGTYDKQKKIHQFLLTGSARMDLYRRGGDSLMGRYHYWRLYPYGIAENIPGVDGKTKLDKLLTVGGFPEPFWKGSETFYKRWRKERHTKIIYEDIKDLTYVKEVQKMSILLDLLRHRVGGEVIYSNLAKDLHASGQTVKNWIDIFEKLYVVFCIYPYSKNINRAITHIPKVYFYDNGEVIGDNFENLIAMELLKKIHYLEDKEGDEYELCYIRDKEKREIDFVIIKNKIPQELIEVKTSQQSISASLHYFADKLNISKKTQIVLNLERSFVKDGVNVIHPLEYFTPYS